MSSSSAASFSLSEAEPGLEPGDSQPNPSDPRSVYHSHIVQFAHLVSRAEDLLSSGQDRQCALSLLYALERYRHSKAYDLLARCLHLLSSILKKHGNYKRALEFSAAEKLIYETQLLESLHIRARAGNGDNNNNNNDNNDNHHHHNHSIEKAIVDAEPVDPQFHLLSHSSIAPKSLALEERRAQQYEQLGRMFYQEKKLDLAKEYVLKAIQIRKRWKQKLGGNRNQAGNGRLSEEELAVLAINESAKEAYEDALKNFQRRGGAGSANANANANDPNAKAREQKAFELGLYDDDDADGNAANGAEKIPKLFHLRETLEWVNKMERKEKKKLKQQEKQKLKEQKQKQKQKMRNENEKDRGGDESSASSSSESESDSDSDSGSGSSDSDSDADADADADADDGGDMDVEIEEFEIDVNTREITKKPKSKVKSRRDTAANAQATSQNQNQNQNQNNVEVIQYRGVNWRALTISLAVGFILLGIFIHYLFQYLAKFNRRIY